MKLRNKKTGKVINAVMTGGNEIEFQERGSLDRYTYSSLAELNEEWEDYEEPRFYWYVGFDGRVREAPTESLKYYEKEFGNYFSTKEEAEKAVEKLKAWKRLKDKGFRFTAWYGGSKNIDYEITSLENETYIPRQICDDLDLLFGGEE